MKTIRVSSLSLLRIEELRNLEEEQVVSTAKGEPLAVIMPYKKFMKIVDDLHRAEEQLRNLSATHLKEILHDAEVKN